VVNANANRHFHWLICDDAVLFKCGSGQKDGTLWLTKVTNLQLFIKYINFPTMDKDLHSCDMCLFLGEKRREHR